jgi:transcriptional regulator with XRE-family HTH domain
MDARSSIRTGRDLAAERVRAGLHQRDLAAVLGVSPRRIGAVEWKIRPSAAWIARYLRAVREAGDAA